MRELLLAIFCKLTDCQMIDGHIIQRHHARSYGDNYVGMDNSCQWCAWCGLLKAHPIHFDAERYR